MEWEELVGTKIAPAVKEEVGEAVALLVEEYISIEKQNKSLSERTKLLRQQITESLPLRKVFETLDSVSRKEFYEAVTYKPSGHKITGSY